MTSESHRNALMAIRWARNRGSKARTLRGAIAYLEERLGWDKGAEAVLALVAEHGIRGRLHPDDYTRRDLEIIKGGK